VEGALIAALGVVAQAAGVGAEEMGFSDHLACPVLGAAP
jgi:hypothetical protein